MLLNKPLVEAFMRYDKYHAITVDMAVLQAKEDRWVETNEKLDLPFLVASEYNGEFIDCGYCLDQAPEYTVRNIQEFLTC